MCVCVCVSRCAKNKGRKTMYDDVGNEFSLFVCVSSSYIQVYSWIYGRRRRRTTNNNNNKREKWNQVLHCFGIAIYFSLVGFVTHTHTQKHTRCAAGARRRRVRKRNSPTLPPRIYIGSSSIYREELSFL